MKLSTRHRKLARLAVLIHEQLQRPDDHGPARNLPELTWMETRRHTKCRHIAQQRGWRLAQQLVHTDVRLSIERLIQELRQLQAQFMSAPTSPASAREIYQDLIALEEEFEDVQWQLQRPMLFVTTEPISLEGRYLGPFEIELDLQRLCPHPTYTVVAQDPQPSRVNSEVCHPHVQGDQLCEGEGAMAIRSAVKEGRLLDFFLIVRNLLRTYNSSSPFVSLDDWDGARCSECDASTSEDTRSSCARCEATLCDQCYRICCDCGDPACGNCSFTCRGCDDDVCTGCQQQCIDCDHSFCLCCLRNEERCRLCHEQTREQAGVSDAALQSL